MILDKISHSMYRDYLSCPKLFYYRHFLKIRPDDKPLPLHFGSALHAGLEAHHKGNGNIIDVFKREFTKDPLNEKDQLKYEDELANGIRLLNKYLEQEAFIRDNLDIQVITSEQYFALTDIKNLLVPKVSGVVDFVTKSGALGDYKTSSKRYKQEDIDSSAQPTFYYLWYLNKFGKLPKEFIYVVFLKKIKKEPIQILSTQRTQEDINNLLTSINEVAIKVENAEFERPPEDQHPRWCDCWKYEEKYPTL